MLSKQEYVALSEFRSQLARFLRFSESAARAAGVTPKQYLILLHIRGVEGRDWATVGELAVRLQSTPNGAVALMHIPAHRVQGFQCIVNADSGGNVNRIPTSS